MSKRNNTLIDDLDTLREALDVVLEHATERRKKAVWGNWSRKLIDDPNQPQRLSPVYTDPLHIADWALKRVIDQLTLKACPDLGGLAEAALQRAQDQADAILKDAKEQAEKEASQEYEAIIRSAKRTARSIMRDADKEVERRMEEMYGRAAHIKRRRRISVVPGKKLVLVDA